MRLQADQGGDIKLARFLVVRLELHGFGEQSKRFLIPALLGAVLTWSWTGAALGFLWGGLVRVFVMNHVIYWCINSVTHTFGTRPFHTRDLSTNNVWLAIPTLGQAWHNNHHAFPGSAIMSISE